ncbi:unnamed protein product [Arctia plantaginis]|uniref:MADF domain-containing protein n=1 Tax=Arctia plantaginis TaxID=874455 RepID=A0A8S0Z494_ARCPL|nr:unnamed protein product [Arctia plantaginis]
MNEELLISLVQKYRELYDLGDPRYHDEQRRMNIWQEIAQILNETHFFTNLGKTVTTFPKDVQIRVKGAVFKIVNDAETDLFCRQVDTNNMSHASRESQNMQTINQQPFAAVILSQNNQFSSIQPLRTSGQASFQASPTTASMLSNSSQQVYEGQVYEVQEHDVQDSEIMEQFLHFPKNK